MAPLKAGRFNEIVGSMAQMMEDAMQSEWGNYHGNQPLPAQGEQDRLIMFKAVARGVLGYLEQHKGDIGTTPSDGGLNHTHELDFEVSDT
jgi:hypothetical protein